MSVTNGEKTTVEAESGRAQFCECFGAIIPVNNPTGSNNETIRPVAK